MEKDLASIAASEFAYNGDGRIEFVKRSVSHTEKARYLFRLARGQAGFETADERPVDLHSPIPRDELAVPFEHMVYVGDGSSDVPVSSLLRARGGVALGVVDDDERGEWERDADIAPGRRVSNLAPPSFAEGSEMLRSLTLAVEMICKRIALRELASDE